MASGLGPIKIKPGCAHRLGEGRVFREKAIAWVNRVAAQPFGDIQNAVAAKVGLAGRWWADAHQLVGQHRVQRGGIGLGVDGHRADVHLLACPNNAHRYLAAVGDQDFREHVKASARIVRSITRRVKRQRSSNPSGVKELRLSIRNLILLQPVPGDLLQSLLTEAVPILLYTAIVDRIPEVPESTASVDGVE